MEIKEIHGGREASHPYGKLVEISEIHGGRETSRPYGNKVMEINGYKGRICVTCI